MDAPDAEPMTFWSSDADEQDPAAWLASIGRAEGDGETAPIAALPDEVDGGQAGDAFVATEEEPA
jgi:hypothetical protein